MLIKKVRKHIYYLYTCCNLWCKATGDGSLMWDQETACFTHRLKKMELINAHYYLHNHSNWLIRSQCSVLTLHIVSLSHGVIVRRSMISQDTLSCSSAILATSIRTWICVPQPTNVTSDPENHNNYLHLVSFIFSTGFGYTVIPNIDNVDGCDWSSLIH